MKFLSDKSADPALCHEGRPILCVGAIVNAHFCTASTD